MSPFRNPVSARILEIERRLEEVRSKRTEAERRYQTLVAALNKKVASDQAFPGYPDLGTPNPRLLKIAFISGLIFGLLIGLPMFLGHL